MGKPRLLLLCVFNPGVPAAWDLAVEQVILCVKYAGVQSKAPQKG